MIINVKLDRTPTGLVTGTVKAWPVLDVKLTWHAPMTGISHSDVSLLDQGIQRVSGWWTKRAFMRARF